MSTFVLYMFLRICQAYFQIKYWMVRWYMPPVYSRYFLYPKLAEIYLFIYLRGDQNFGCCFYLSLRNNFCWRSLQYFEKRI